MKMRITTAVLALVLPFAVGGLVEAHDAVTGWMFPQECCSKGDCYEIDKSEVEPVTDGWRIVATNEVIKPSSTLWNGSPRLRTSEDQHWYRCSEDRDRLKETFCLFVPAGG